MLVSRARWTAPRGIYANGSGPPGPGEDLVASKDQRFEFALAAGHGPQFAVTGEGGCGARSKCLRAQPAVGVGPAFGDERAVGALTENVELVEHGAVARHTCACVRSEITQDFPLHRRGEVEEVGGPYLPAIGHGEEFVQ